MSVEEEAEVADTRSDRRRIRSDVGEEGYIKLDRVTKTFNNGEVIATEDFTLDIGSTEFVVLLGPSGCGKTTTLRCIAGLDIPDSGQITIGEEDITNKKPKDRNLAFVFQTIALFPHMTVRENIRFGLDMTTDLSADEKEEQVKAAATTLGIEEMLDRKPSALSGGQQQRVALGRAMIMDPAAFLLDEPFSALDANLRDQMRVEVKKLQRELETAMIFVTHDQEEAMTVGDKIVVMNDARIMQIGSPYEIYNDPQNEFVAQFIGSPSTNFFDCEYRENNGDATLENELFTIPLSTEQRNDLSADPGDSLRLAVRPEFIQVAANPGLFEAEITVVEPQGARDAVYFEAGGQELRATTDQNVVSEEDEAIPLDFERDKFWIFNRRGERVL